MIEHPKNLTEQLLNLVERVAVEIRTIYNKLKSAVYKVNGQVPDEDGNIQITEVTKASQDMDGNVISTTYVKKTDKVSNAISAETAIKANQDSLGNTIVDTYATKEEVTEKAPSFHASTETIYGVSSDSEYGHVKLSDSVSSTSTSTSGIAASPKAVKTAYDLANTANMAASVASNTANTAKTTAESAQQTANNALPKTGGNITGNVTITGTLTIL